MGTTPLGIVYPDSTSHNRIWEHAETLADDVDDLITADRTSRDAAWSTYTPVITGSTSGTWSAGGTTITARYTRKGRLVIANVDLALGAGVSITGSTVGSLMFSLPVTAQASGVPGHIGTGLVIDTSAGLRIVTACEIEGNNKLVMVRSDTGAIIAHNTFTYASTDLIRFQVMYEAASAP